MKLILHLILVSLVLMFVAISTWAQSPDDLKSKYGAPFNAYEIRPGIMMTVKFDESGQASEMRVERHNNTDSMVYLDTTIPPDLSKEIVDELAPVAARGAKTDFSGFTVITGGGGTATEDYENVAITYYTRYTKECSGLVAIVIRWKSHAQNPK